LTNLGVIPASRNPDNLRYRIDASQLGARQQHTGLAYSAAEPAA
jgi:hypothetical protein